MAMLPAFTAFMISSSLFSSVPPKNCMSSSPPERLRTSAACQSKAIAADSGTALRCAMTSFLGSARAKPGARPLARMPAMPPFTRLRRRMDARLRLLIFMIVDMRRPPRRLIMRNLYWRWSQWEALWSITEQRYSESGENHAAGPVEAPPPDALHQMLGQTTTAERVDEIES